MKLLKHYYQTIKIKRWFKNNINGINSYRDKSIIIENVKSINNNKVSERIELVEDLWTKNKDFFVWGSELYNLEQAYFDILSEKFLSKEIDELFIMAGNYSLWKGHLSRISLLSILLKNNYFLEPILINENRLIIDGFHRLVAYKITNYNYIPSKLINLKK